MAEDAELTTFFHPADVPAARRPVAPRREEAWVPVTRPYLPPLAELLPLLERLWASHHVTNGGALHAQFEAALAEHLGVAHLSLFNNGTTALLLALRVLDLEGEVITTPYSFVASAHAIRWAGLEPVFVDVEPGTLNLDPRRIEAAITPRTSAILPVHCYGHACDVDAIRAIAERHGLGVVYDAAHAFGVVDRGASLLRHGDLSVLSLHATKVFNTFEGGAVVCPDAATKRRLDALKNFGLVDDGVAEEAGLNGKMSEFNAALGLVQLTHVGAAIERRRAIDARYRAALGGQRGLRLVTPLPAAAEDRNCAYFPVLVEDTFGCSRDELAERLRARGIQARRYFHPLISEQAPYRGLPSADPARLPVAADAARRVLCLPIHPDLTAAEQQRVIDAVRAA